MFSCESASLEQHHQAHLAVSLEQVSICLQVLLVGDQEQLLLNAAGEDLLAVLVVELDGGGQLLGLDQVSEAVLGDLALEGNSLALLVCKSKRGTKAAYTVGRMFGRAVPAAVALQIPVF